jgi:FkbM family methyltransferase
MFLSKYRKAVDTFAPPLGRSFRVLRDVTSRRRAIQTPYGFSLVGDPAIAAAGWEGDEIAAFLSLLESHDVVVDIGANVGIYSCLAASRGKKTVAIEPLRRNLNYLYKNLWDNQLRNVEVFPMGLARVPGLGRIYGYGGIASFLPGWAQAREAHSTLVPLTSLDAVVNGRFSNKRLLIKLDVEGFELEVLAGAVGTLDRIPKPTWLVEILFRGELVPGGLNSRFTETFAIFWERGYSCHKLDAALTPVGPDQVSSWISDGSVDGDTRDFLFSGRLPSGTVEGLHEAEDSGWDEARPEEKSRPFRDLQASGS